MRQETEKEIKLHEKFKVHLNEQSILSSKELRIKFVSVKEDSRCPQGVDCLWAGNGKIEIKVIDKNEDSAILELNTELEPKSVSYKRFHIALISLEPYPKAEQNIKEEDYSAILAVSEAS